MLMRILNCMITCSATRINYLSYSLLFLLVSSVLTGCRKNEDTVGADFLGKRNPIDLASDIDTTSIITYNARHDSIATYRSGTTLTYYMLGEMNDPELGSTRASIITHYTLPVNGFKFGADYDIDSVILQVALIPTTTYSYGNDESIQKISVFELGEDLRTDSFYFSNRNYQYSASMPLGSWQGTAKSLKDSVRLPTVTLPPHIRIKLNAAEFLVKLKNGEASGAFTNNTTFKNLFKGLIINPTNASLAPGEGSLIYADMKSGLTALVVYYSVPGVGSTKAEFTVSSADVKINKYEHDIKPGVVLYPVMNGQHQETTYLQPAGGIKTRILFPHLFDYVKNNQIAVTGAELTISLKQGTYVAPYTQPKELRLLSSDSLGRNDFIIDQNLGANYYGGQEKDGVYRFNIIRHIQNVLNEYKNYNRNINYGLNLIVPADNPIMANRAILDTRLAEKNIKLKLTYTVIK